MSAIDDYIEHMTAHAPGHATLTIDARDELAKLRSELEEFRAKANVSICAWCGQECEKESGAIAEHVIVCEKRPEHAMLAKFDELIRDNINQADELAQLRAAVDERDAAIERARAEEREACIVALDELHTESDDEYYTLVAAKAAIRARGENGEK